MQIAMIGTGYVGLVTGACFSEFGAVVTCVDSDKVKIERLNNGEIPIFEPGLEALVQSNVKAGRLFFSCDLRTAVAKKGRFYVQAGAGIVADSKPLKEYEETVNKAKALINALK